MVGLLALKKGAYDVITARDGEEGVEKAMRERPDLILMDVVLPRLDGFSAVRRLKAHDETREIPVIMLTSRGGTDTVGAAFAGAEDCITKPIDAQDLVAKVRSQLGSR